MEATLDTLWSGVQGLGLQDGLDAVDQAFSVSREHEVKIIHHILWLDSS